MEQNYPLQRQITTQFCFLSPLDGHESVIQDLNSAVLLYSTQLTPSLNYDQVLQTLQVRYGGSASQWRVRRVSSGYLIYIPTWLYRDELYLDSHFWECHFFIPHPWQALNATDSLPPLQRVYLTILDFPLDYWHPYYIRQAMASMGVVTAIHRDCLSGEDYVSIRLWLDTPNLNLVPFWLKVGHQTSLSTCPIFMEGRQSPANFPPYPPPYDPPEPDGSDHHQSQSHAVPNHPDASYVPPWRRRTLSIQVPPQDLSSSGAPAANNFGLGFWLTTHCCAPGSHTPATNRQTVPLPGQQRMADQLRWSAFSEDNKTRREYATTLNHHPDTYQQSCPSTCQFNLNPRSTEFHRDKRPSLFLQIYKIQIPWTAKTPLKYSPLQAKFQNHLFLHTPLTHPHMSLNPGTNTIP